MFRCFSVSDPSGSASERHILALVIAVDMWISAHSCRGPDALVSLLGSRLSSHGFRRIQIPVLAAVNGMDVQHRERTGQTEKPSAGAGADQGQGIPRGLRDRSAVAHRLTLTARLTHTTRAVAALAAHLGRRRSRPRPAAPLRRARQEPEGAVGAAGRRDGGAAAGDAGSE